jgi:urease accessory protein
MPKRAKSKLIKVDRAFSRRDRRPATALKQLLPNLTSTSNGASNCSEWLVWQLVDSAFPAGGFAHSGGLEAAWQHGEVHGRDELVLFVEAGLDQLGHASLPFVLAAFDEWDRVPEFDKLCHAFTNNPVANRASRAQGRAFLIAMSRIFRVSIGTQNVETAWPHGHFTPVFGACLSRLGVPRETAGRMFFFNQLRSLLAAAVRLNIVGPLEGQILAHRLFPQAESILKQCERLTLDDIAQTAPLLDLWQGAHDRLYSRLFQS